MPKIRAAILGYGRSGSSLHAGAYAANADAFEVVAVCDTDEARRRQAVERFGCRVYSDYHELFAKEQLDLVSIVTRSDQHCQMTCDALAAGVNVLVTKPWAVNAAEGERMIAAAHAAKKRLFPWLPARWGADYARLRELLAAHAIGKVFFVRRAVCSFSTRCDWQTERRYGGGYLLNWGAHILDPPVLLAGSPVRTVFGRLRQTIIPGDTEDVFYALMTLADGTLVQAEYSVATIDLPGWFIQGDRGTIEVRGRELVLSQRVPPRPDDPTRYGTMKAEGTITRETIAGSIWGDEQVIYRELAAELQGTGRYPVTPADALAVSRVFDAVRASNDENRVVNLSP